MLNLDFIEIGTGNINTLIEEANDDTYGISIEPVKHHFNNLPDKKNVIKINCAISKNQERSKDYIYYIKPEDFKQSLPPGLINCNSVGSYHERHLEWNIKDLVTKELVELIPLQDILKQYDIHKIKFLKIDAEGFDSFILESVLDYWKTKDKSYWPEVIQFESNILADFKSVKRVIREYEKIGYQRQRTLKNNKKINLITTDTVLILL